MRFPSLITIAVLSYHGIVPQVTRAEVIAPHCTPTTTPTNTFPAQGEPAPSPVPETPFPTPSSTYWVTTNETWGDSDTSAPTPSATYWVTTNETWGDSTTPTATLTGEFPSQGQPQGDTTPPTATPTGEFPAQGQPAQGQPTEPGSCADGYVYCPDISTCFMDATFNNGTMPVGDNPWGWSLNFENCDGMQVCAIYINVKGCDLTTGTQVGTAEIDHDMFRYQLYEGQYVSNTYNLYAGTCQANDAGDSLSSSDGTCDEQEVADYARDVSTFPLIVSGGEFRSDFTLDEVREESFNVATSWPNYNVFPLGMYGRNYVVGHLYVCPATPTPSSPVASPPFGEQGGPTLNTDTPSLFGQPTAFLIVSPTTSPASFPTMTPSREPIVTTEPPTKEPTSMPISAPSSTPIVSTLPPTESPSFVPIITSSTIPTNSPTSTPASLPSSIPTKLLIEPTTMPSTKPVISTSSPISKSSRFPIIASLTPIIAVSETPMCTPSHAPTPNGTCSVYPKCANLTGDCCPTADGVFLECCKTDVPTTDVKPPVSPPTIKAPTSLRTPSKSPMFLASDLPSEDPTFIVEMTYPTNLPTQTIMVPTSQKPAGKPFADTEAKPSASPSTEPTVQGTFGGQGDGECETAFVYCPGRSTCFTNISGITPSDDSMWGWSIQYNASEGVVLDCDIYVGASNGCQLDTATKVGTFTISKNLVHYSLDLGNYESNSFQFYSGRCPANDGGLQMINNGTCSDVEMSTFADQTDTYTLVYNSDTYQDTYAFDETSPCSEIWGNVSGTCKVFPIGEGENNFLSAALDVCPIIKQPTITPTAAPARKPAASIPTAKSPLSKPLAPSTAKLPTISPTNVYIPAGEPCKEALVYCPDRSVSFQDASFNNGIAAKPDSNGNSCGWSIKYEYCDGVVDDCVILTDLDEDCDPDSGTVIGTFYFGNDFLHYCITDKSYIGASFHAYVGICEANDNGEQVVDDGVCDPDIIATYATNYTTYPLISDNEYSRSFTFDEKYVMPIEVNNVWQGQQILPMDLETKYITALVCVVSPDSIK